jgi:hypothetical protein
VAHTRVTWGAETAGGCINNPGHDWTDANGVWKSPTLVNGTYSVGNGSSGCVNIAYLCTSGNAPTINNNNVTGINFIHDVYSISASPGTGGSMTVIYGNDGDSPGVNPPIVASGSVRTPCGTDMHFTITPNSCYHIADVIVDGASVGAVSNYTFSNVRTNHTISATFAINTYTIIASSGPHASIFPGTVSVNCGSTQGFTFGVEFCYHIADVVVDGVSIGPVGSYAFSNVQAGHSISVTAAINTYTISASAGTGGSISPGSVTVNCGSGQTFAITPNSCYHIADVVVDGASVGAVSSYTFSSVQTNHSISASFAINIYSINASAGAGGSVSPGGNVIVGCGGSQTFTISPDGCHTIADVVVDGSSVGAVGSYTFNGVVGNHSIAATFALKTYTIAASAGTGGSISPGGNVAVGCGASQTFVIAAAEGYHLAALTVDGNAVPLAGSYTFTNVAAGHTIVAGFALDAFTILASAGPHGRVTPSGAVIVSYGSDQAFALTPDPGYSVTTLRVDGGLVPPAGAYTFAHVTANHTLEVLFADVTPPEVHVVDPNGGDTLIVGMDVTLCWTATDAAGVESVDLLLSRDNGATQEEIAAGIPNTGSYDWRVTSPAPCAVRPAALLTVVARDLAGNVGSDASDAPFALYDLATGTLLSLFEANVVDERVELRWQMGTSGLFRAATIERAEAVLGPWAPLGLEARDDGGFSVALDRGVAPGRTYYYRLCATTASGERMTFGPLKVTMGVPIREFSLAPVAPNPSSGPVRIEYTVPRESWLRLSVFDAQGREVAVLIEGGSAPGRHAATWSTQRPGGKAPAGIYFIRLQTEGGTMVRRVAIVH